MAASAIPRLSLPSGGSIPQLGFGLFMCKADVAEKAVKDAISAGFRHLDCATAYSNEKQVGAALESVFKEGIVKREDLFITTKLWNTFHRADLVKKCLQQSLVDLGVAYVDLYLIHWPMGYKEDRELFPKDEKGEFILSDVDFMDTWRAMEEVKREGLARAIGISNFNAKQLQRVLDEGTIHPDLLQVESHPYFPNDKLFAFAREKGLVTSGFSPFGSPDRAFAKPDDPKPLQDPVILEIAAKHNRTPAQVILRWQIQRGHVVLVKTTTFDHMKDNLNVFDFSLSDEEVSSITALDRGFRAVHLTWVKHHKYFPFSDPF